MSKIITGRVGAIEQPLTFGFSQSRGDFQRRTWKCTSVDAARALIPQLIEGGYSYELTEGPVPILTAELAAAPGTGGGGGGSEEVPTDNWELVPNVVEKDIIDSNVAGVQDISQSNLESLRKFIQTPEEGRSPSFTGTAQQQAACAALYLQMQKGLRSIRIYQPILRFTRSVSRNWQTKASTANVGNILSNSFLLSSPADGAGLPSGFLVALNAPPFSNSTTGYMPNTKWGWLKGYPSISLASYNRIQTTQDWEWGLWSTLVYTHIP